MARYRKIDPRIWNDAKFSSLSNDAKLLFLYLLTSPQTQMIGAVPMRAESVAAELGFDTKRYGIRYQELYKLGIAEYDDRGLYWVKNFLKYNSPDNPKVVISWRECLDFLPECPLLKKLIDSAKAHCISRGEQYVEAFQKGIGNSMAYGIRNGMSYKEQEQEQEQEISIPSKDGIVETSVSVPQPSESEKVEKTTNGIDCPYQKIVADYNEILGPFLGKCQKLTPTRQRNVQARWRDCMKDGDFQTQEDGLAYFRRYFEYIKTCDFLMGNNNREWRADFDWIFKQQNYTKICEGKYLSR